MREARLDGQPQHKPGVTAPIGERRNERHGARTRMRAWLYSLRPCSLASSRTSPTRSVPMRAGSATLGASSSGGSSNSKASSRVPDPGLLGEEGIEQL